MGLELLQVRMHVSGWCKMGISFWPSFRFKAPDRGEEGDQVRVSPAGVSYWALPEQPLLKAVDTRMRWLG